MTLNFTPAYLSSAASQMIICQDVTSESECSFIYSVIGILYRKKHGLSMQIMSSLVGPDL